MDLPKELVKDITGFAFSATACEHECRERCAMSQEEARQHQHIAMNLRAEVAELHVERFVVRGMARSIESLHEALARERIAHAQTKRNTTRQINALKRKLDPITASPEASSPA